ncbi:hypothetical protein M413DRAFT_446533 [Hebeloma cylindrosporum]|uniref:Elongator complex protein 5 n=1 Tax=Hebeloma cylindrosporum TaxID=76867 RepID=A0A0C3C9T0_HEBCY|nr:hypothetical protein M413DRAFT_446533 [Hebeloma cylindrosporum h7]
MPGLFPPFDLPDGIVLLITDQLAAPADFILHRTLAIHLRERRKPSSLILSVSEGFGRWKALAAKSNLNLAHHVDAGSLEFVDVLPEIQPTADRRESLRILIKRVQVCLDRAAGPALIILDDISALDWIGFPLLDLSRFLRALRAACLKANATLIIRHHIVTPGEADELFRHLLQISTYHVEDRPLSSGRSGDVSGEISLHPGFSVPSDGVKLNPRNIATQYRLADTGPEFFAKGTSGGVL